MAVIKIQTGLRLEENLYNKLKHIADKDGRSLNNLMEFIARQYVDNYEALHGSIPQSQD